MRLFGSDASLIAELHIAMKGMECSLKVKRLHTLHRRYKRYTIAMKGMDCSLKVRRKSCRVWKLAARSA